MLPIRMKTKCVFELQKELMQILDIYRKILTNSEGIKLGRPVGIILGVIVVDGTPLLD